MASIDLDSFSPTATKFTVTRLVTITNVSKQTVPILITNILSSDASTTATVAANIKGQLKLPVGSKTTIESQRIDSSQLSRLQNLGLITYIIG